MITLSQLGFRIARRIAASLPGCTIYLHENVGDCENAKRFSRVQDLVSQRFFATDGIVFVGPCGVIVRAIAPLLESKYRDPPVLAVDVGGRFVVSLLSGHEGGANDLTVRVANVLDAEPIITTSTEAAKTLIVGIGCRRQTAAETIVGVLKDALQIVGRSVQEVRFLATADVKACEPGIQAAARQLGIPLRIISSQAIRSCRFEFRQSSFVEEKVGLPAVAEPAALLAGRRTRLLLPTRKQEGVTVAIAEESCSW